jgi:hypothetical protein
LVCFIVFGQLKKAEDAHDWDNPETTTELNLDSKSLTELPEKLKEFKQVAYLNLYNNDISEFNQDILSNMPALAKISLRKNPIKEIPEWVADLGLSSLDVSKTQITAIPARVRENIHSLIYDHTPLYEAEMKALEKEEGTLIGKENAGTQESESFTQFATRSLLGKDYGSHKDFKKGSIYYTANIPDTLVNKLGNFMIETEYFSDEKEVDVQLTFEGGEVNSYVLKMITNEEEVSEEIKMAFQFFGWGALESVFNNKPFQIHLTDPYFETKEIIELK